MAYEIETVFTLSDAELFTEMNTLGIGQFLWDALDESDPGYAQYQINLANFTVPGGADGFEDIQFSGNVNPVPTWADTKQRFFDYVNAEHQAEFNSMNIVNVLSELKIQGMEFFSAGSNWPSTVIMPVELKPTWSQMKAKAAELLAAAPSLAAKNAVLRAMSFGQNLMAEYGAKNILRGYTTAQVRQIATDLAGIQALLLSGSLYSALEDIAAFTPTALILQSDIDEFTAKLQTYLGL